MSYPLRVVKQETKVAVDAVKPEPGDILIIHPKRSDEKFSDDFCKWLADTMPEVLPPGVKALILANDSTTIEKLQPNEAVDLPGNPAEAYRLGWHSAVEALERFYEEESQPKLIEAE